MSEVSFAVPLQFTSHVEAALLRLGYLYPDITWTYDTQSRELKASDCSGPENAAKVAQEIKYQLYRTKIFEDTRVIRDRIYEALSE